MVIMINNDGDDENLLPVCVLSAEWGSCGYLESNWRQAPSSSLSLLYHRLTITNGDSPYCYQFIIISPSSYYHLINILPPPHHHLTIISEPNWRQAIELSFSSMSSLPSLSPSLSSSSSPPPLSSAAKMRIKGVSGSPMRRYRPLQ